MDIKKSYVVFATSHGDSKDGYVEVDKKPLTSVPHLVAGESKPVNAGDGFADWTLIEHRLKGLTGRILTVIDAAIPAGKQNKSVKDIIRSHIMDEYMFFGDQLFDQERLRKAANESLKDMPEDEIKPVGFDEILGR